MRISFIQLLAMALVTGCQIPDRQGGEKAILYQNLEKHIMELSADKYMGRMPMSETEPAVIGYFASQMQEIGLEGANNGSYFMEVPIRRGSSVISPILDFSTPAGKVSLHKLTEYVSFSRKVQDESVLQDPEVIFAGFGKLPLNTTGMITRV